MCFAIQPTDSTTCCLKVSEEGNLISQRGLRNELSRAGETIFFIMLCDASGFFRSEIKIEF